MTMAAEQQGKAKKRLREPKPALPACPVHGFEMYVGSSPAGWRYCYCPADGCPESDQQRKAAIR